MDTPALFTPGIIPVRKKLFLIVGALLAGRDVSGVISALTAPNGVHPPHVILSGHNTRIHVIADHTLADEILRRFDEGELNKDINAANVLSVFGATGLLNSEGLTHRELKINTAGRMSHITAKMSEIILDRAKILIDGWVFNRSTSDLASDVRNFTLNAYCKGSLGWDLQPERIAKLARSVDSLSRYSIFVFALKLWKKPSKWMYHLPVYKRALQNLAAGVDDLITTKLAANNDDNDVVTSILKRNGCFQNSQTVRMAQAREEIFHLLAAGSTPTLPIAHALATLAANKPKLEELAKALADVNIDSPNCLQPILRSEKLRNFADAMFKEAPPIPISLPRVAMTDIEIPPNANGIGLKIAKGDIVIINIQALSPPLNSKRDANPFLLRGSACPGRNFSMQLMMCVLAVAVKRLESMHLYAPTKRRMGSPTLSYGGRIGFYGKQATTAANAGYMPN